MKDAIIILRTVVDDYLGASSFCRLKIRFAVDSLLAIFMSSLYEACHENLMPLLGDNDRSVNRARAVVHGQFLRLCSSVGAVPQRMSLV